MNIKQKTNLIITVYGIILILGIFIAFQGSNYNFMTGDDVKTIDGDDFFSDLNRTVMSYGDTEKRSFETTLSKEDFPILENSDYNLVIFRLASNGYKVYFNDHFLGGFGHYETGNSNLWNGIKRYQISRAWLEDENTLRIESNSKYMSGLTTHPIFITSTIKATRMVASSRIFNHNAVMASLGISMLAIVVLLVLYWSGGRRRDMYISLAASMFFLGIYSIDYATTEYMFIDYMLYKKVIMISFWLCTFFVGVGLKQLFNHYAPLISGAIGLIGIIVIAVFSTDLIMFKTLYGYWYFSQILNIVVWLLIIFKSIPRSIEARVFFTGFIVLFVYSVINATLDYTGIFFSMNSSVIYTAVFSIMPLMLVYLDFTKSKQDLHEETLLKEAAYYKAVTDALTGAYNKHHLFTVLEEMGQGYSVAMFDIDNFKEVNDNFGHQGGDAVLKHLSDELRHFLREEDKLFRYGGDEFIVVMKCPLHIVNQRMELFREKIATQEISYGMLKIKATLSIGLFYVEKLMESNEVLDAVDSALYLSKGAGKNRISIYNR